MADPAAAARARDPGDSARQADAGAGCRPSSATGGRPSRSGRTPTSGSRRSGSEHPEGSTQLVLAARDEPRETHVLKRGDFLKPAQVGRAGRAGVPAIRCRPDAPPTRLTFARWLVDRKSPTTARVARQSRLAGLFRHRHRRDQRGLRHAVRAAVASRAARLAGRRVHGSRLEPEEAAPADRDLGDLPAVVAA